MEIHKTTTASAYVIGRDAAINMVRKIIPIKVAADAWGHYFYKGCFSSFRVLYPAVVSTKNFKSSIDYLNKEGLAARLSSTVDKYKIPILYQALKQLRRRRTSKVIRHIGLTDSVSPIGKDRV